jgi:protein-S-isoprenylcysteine O-methyltransferase Ste14
MAEVAGSLAGATLAIGASWSAPSLMPRAGPAASSGRAVSGLIGSFIVAGLDVGRFHWSDSVPPALQAVGLVLFAAAMVVETWAVAVNRFFSSVVRIQRDRGHHVITTGPYRYVRHPDYAGAPWLFLGGGLALGSWLALLLHLAMIPAMIRRTVIEDRCLWQELDGYAPYAETVRYRLIPGVW